MVSPCGKYLSDFLSRTDYSTSSLIIINEALFNLGPAYTHSLISLCYICSSNTEWPTVLQINPAVSFQVFACAVPPMQNALLFSQGTILPRYSGQQAPAQGTFLFLSVTLSLSTALVLCILSISCISCVSLCCICFLAHLSPLLDCEIIEASVCTFII